MAGRHKVSNLLPPTNRIFKNGHFVGYRGGKPKWPAGSYQPGGKVKTRDLPKHWSSKSLKAESPAARLRALRRRAGVTRNELRRRGGLNKIAGQLGVGVSDRKLPKGQALHLQLVALRNAGKYNPKGLNYAKRRGRFTANGWGSADNESNSWGTAQGPGHDFLPAGGPTGPPIHREPGFGQIQRAPDYLRGQTKAEIASFMKEHKGEGRFKRTRHLHVQGGRPKERPTKPTGVSASQWAKYLAYVKRTRKQHIQPPVPYEQWVRGIEYA